MADREDGRDRPAAADKEWVERIAAGNEEAFEELVRVCHPTMFRLALRLLRNQHDAQEVVQEAFLAAYEGIESFRGRANVRTWLLSITFHKGVDRLKRTTRDQWAISGDLENSAAWSRMQMVSETTDWKRDPEQIYERRELRERLEQALEQVPARSKAVFELRDVQGLTSREVADALDISEGAVRVTLHRVRQYLMVALQDFSVQKER